MKVISLCGTPMDISAGEEDDSRRAFERKRRRSERHLEVTKALSLPLQYPIWALFKYAAQVESESFLM